ncbi:serine/threonine kinase, partial [Mytilinidion resinicola]
MWKKGQMISKGSHCRAYLGINMVTGKLLVVKEYAVRSKEEQKRLALDKDTFFKLDHVNLVQILGLEESKSNFIVFEEYVTGSSLRSLMPKDGKLEDSVIRSFARQTTAALAYLHSEGVLHRNLEADEIQLNTGNGTCKLCLNFDTSRTSNWPDKESSAIGAGTWLAPEVVRSSGNGYSAKADVWSLGCCVLEMMAGDRPWSLGAIYMPPSLAPPIPDDVAAEANTEGIAFIYDCFTIDPSERPSADTLLRNHPYIEIDPTYDFLRTELYAKIK